MWSSYIKYLIFANIAKRHSHLVIIPKDLQKFSSLDEWKLEASGSPDLQ